MANSRRGCVRIAAVQLQSQASVENNLRACELQIAAAADQGARLVVLPENFAVFGGDEARHRSAERLDGDGPIVSCLRSSARAHGVAIIAGGMPEQSAVPTRPFNTCVCVDSNGVVVGAYRKLHLFDVELAGERYAESAGTTPGDVPLTLELSGLKVGLSICYDLRFPELFRHLVGEGAEVLTVTAAFTEQTGRAHWEVLIRARAIESQCWVVAAAQWGQHPNHRRTFGHSMVVSPWGEVSEILREGEGVVSAELDLGLVDECRSRLPCLRHRRL